MRTALTIAFASVMIVAGAAFAAGPRDSAGDFFVSAIMNTPHDRLVVRGESHGEGGGAFLLPNDGTGSAIVVGCEEACSGVHIELRAAGLPPLSASNSAEEPHAVVLAIPTQYAHSLSNFEANIAIGCRHGGGCFYNWGLLASGATPTLAQRGLRAAPSDAEWNAGAPPAGALRWTVRPNGDDLRFFYPIEAWNGGSSGSAHLQCLVMSDGWLRCRARDETPAGADFGMAARRLSTMLRVETTDAAGQPSANRRVEIPVQFSRAH